MIGEPFTLALPIVREPVSGIEHVVILARPIQHLLGSPPTHYEVLGMSRDGKHRQFTVLMSVYLKAQKHLANFIQVTDLQAPAAQIGNDLQPRG